MSLSDGGMSMKRSRRVVNKRSACMTWEEAVYLTAIGGKPRPDFAPRGCPDLPGVVIREVKCPGCLNMHSPAEVDSCMAIPKPNVPSTNGALSSSTATIGQLLTPFSKVWEFLQATSYG